MRRVICLLLLAAAGLAGLAAPAAAGTVVRLDPPDDPRWKNAPAFLNVPPGVKPGRLYPLFVALHGNGEQAEKYAARVGGLSTPKQPAYILAPEYQTEPVVKAPKFEEWWLLIVAHLEAVVEQYPIDRSRIILEGFSMGGNGSGQVMFRVWGQDPEACPLAAVCQHGGMAAPWNDRLKVPDIPNLLICGEKETKVLGYHNVVREAREVYAKLYARGIDVRYHEFPGLGHTVNDQILALMREILDDLPDYGAAVAPLQAAKKFAAEPIALAGRGKFAEAIAVLTALEATEKKAAKVRKALEGWLKKHASTEPRRLGARWSQVGHTKYEQLAASLESHEKLGPLFAKGLKALAKMRVVKGELLGREKYLEAVKIEDTEARIAALEALATGPFKITRFGRRAGGHATALTPPPPD